jgi:hypothetical protein
MPVLLADVSIAADPSQGSGLWFYVFAGVVAVAIFTSGVLALRWSLRRGDFPSELEAYDKNALTIFDEEEPVGRQTDFFPGKRPASKRTASAGPEA